MENNIITATIWHPKLKKYQLAHYQNGKFTFYTGYMYQVRLNDAKFKSQEDKKHFYSQI
ncbi:MAG TPA: hypothetical protein PKD00_00285 [Burkholderiales bacterium]|nr:hypothetical protein [Burkholderiales bacterium]